MVGARRPSDGHRVDGRGAWRWPIHAGELTRMLGEHVSYERLGFAAVGVAAGCAVY
jgi:hypothetical protein